MKRWFLFAVGAALTVAAVPLATASTTTNANLRLTDFPPGWHSRPPTSFRQRAPKIPACDGLRTLQAVSAVTKHSPEFSAYADFNPLVTSSVTRYRSKQDAQRVIAGFVDDRTLRCLTKGSVYLAEHEKTGVTAEGAIRHVATTQIGDRAAAIEFTLTVHDGARTSAYHRQLEFIRVGRTLAQIDTTGKPAADFAIFRDRLAQLVVTRILSPKGGDDGVEA